MTLLALLRHAEAVRDDGRGDHARPLSTAGREAAAAVGRRLRALMPPETRVIASDACRTRQTAELAFPVAGGVNPSLEPSLYAALPDDILAVIRAQSRCDGIVVAGHNPGISEMASLLAGDGAPAGLAQLAEGLATAEAVVLSFEGCWQEVAPKAGHLVALLARTNAKT